ncbi:MAG TPA: sugar transferase [Acidobacteriaceae bacterium]|nr:sugar transferase [Acidobacteriaceae bacterium]
MIKRGVDLVVSAVLLCLAAPVLLLAAAAIAMESPGSVLFRQERTGRGFRPFTIFKLRTMAHNAPGLEYTLGHDPRITRVGQWLRYTKIDELPQLWNVLRGDMSLIGPRPVIPGLADDFFIHYRLLLRARPGLTDPASLKYRQETELLEQAGDREHFFRHVVTPDKINISLEYMEKATLWSDLSLLCMTVFVCLAPSLSRLYGRPPMPPGRPVFQPATSFKAETMEKLPVWAPTDTSLLPQAADLRLAEDFAEWNKRTPWSLLPELDVAAKLSRGRANRSSWL